VNIFKHRKEAFKRVKIGQEKLLGVVVGFAVQKSEWLLDTSDQNILIFGKQRFALLSSLTLTYLSMVRKPRVSLLFEERELTPDLKKQLISLKIPVLKANGAENIQRAIYSLQRSPVGVILSTNSFSSFMETLLSAICENTSDEKLGIPLFVFLSHETASHAVLQLSKLQRRNMRLVVGNQREEWTEDIDPMFDVVVRQNPTLQTTVLYKCGFPPVVLN